MARTPSPARRGTAHRGRVVAVRLSDAEHAQWTQAAAAAGRQQLGAWVRHEMTDALATSTGARWAPSPFLQDLRGQLSRVGNNLNQLARLANTSQFDPAMSGEALRSIEEARKIMGWIREELGYRG